MLDLLKELRQERDVIKNAPWSFAIVCGAAFATLWGGFHYVYLEKLDDSEKLISQWKSSADYWKDVATRKEGEKPKIAESKQNQPGPVEKQKVLIRVPEPTDGVLVTDKKKFRNNDPSAPYGLEIALETDRERGPLGLIIQTDVEMDKRSYANLPEGHSYEKANHPERLGNHPDMLGIKWYSPAWKPHEPIVVHIVSANPIDLKRVIPNIPGWGE